MHENQFSESFSQLFFEAGNNVLGLWLFSIPTNPYPISTAEKNWSNHLEKWRLNQFQLSRGCVRQVLSDLSGVPNLDIPLNAPPGEPPTLNKGFGCISFSHCSDSILIGWSSQNIGVDLERIDRSFKAEQILNRYYSSSEQEVLNCLEGDNLRKTVLKKWVGKEAAIKWQRGSISSDLSHWSINESSQTAFHDSKKLLVKVSQIEYKE